MLPRTKKYSKELLRVFTTGHLQECSYLIRNLLFFATLVFGSVASGHPAKLSPELEQVDANASVPVIVQFVNQPGDSDHQRISVRGGNLRSKLRSVRGAAYSVPAYALKDLAQDPTVKYISPDRPIAAKLDYSTTAINASAAWESAFLGSGISVAVIDSGVTPVRDLSGKRLIYSEDFVGGNGHDEYGHGEHIAGIIGASGASSECPRCERSLKGVAPKARVVNLRVLDENGHGSDSTVIAAIERAITLKDEYNIRVINLSVGRPVYESYKLDPLCQAVEEAWKAGIVVVVAAGQRWS